MSGSNYSSYVDKKLTELKRKRAELDKEIERFMAALSVIQEADSADLRTDLFSLSGNSEAQKNMRPSKVIVAECLTSSEQMMKTHAIFDYVKRERKITRNSVIYALETLQKKGTVFRNGNKLWGLAGRDYAT